MATLEDNLIELLKGNWVMNKELTGDTDPILKLQKVPWLLRRALAAVTIHLKISGFLAPSPLGEKPLPNFDFIQTATGGLVGTTEKRTLNWEVQAHADYIFGSVQHQSHFIRGTTDARGYIRPEFEMQTSVNSAEIKQFLRGEIMLDGSESPGFLLASPNSRGDGKDRMDIWIHTFERNLQSGWTAEQIWGFESIGATRYFCRRVVAASIEGRYKGARLVYGFRN
ncbi:hypothetical protein BO82DRAFT_374491 [Aspergillus uvarum CBS 121591]|uniref:Uncharacterized protein n=1 Tax=Aspergillus uvarum CBS 121591 TaxID=1448315 RepID=A0A319CDP8_9EURO|nr:hypothetical protein BO82DRAFT_374491 [Aspergillus uvarum CBS 121591]PYH81831.1 hypothetical protein BO82DRAFT_374491 [Aspergillus uvarum CBS 121591]